MGAYGHCPTCGSATAMPGDYCKGHQPPRVVNHGSFRNDVEASTAGACMFCSDPFATLAFKNDDTVRICAKCLDW